MPNDYEGQEFETPPEVEEAAPTSKSMADTAKKLWLMKQEVDELEEAVKTAKEDVTRLELDLFNRMVEAGMDKMTVDGVSFRPEIKVHASLDKGCGEDLIYAVLRERGHGGMIKETVNATTFAAWAREQIEANGGEDLPAWAAEFTRVYKQFRIATRRGAK